MSLPSGTVTFLFTDLEGSTRLWEQHPSAMRLALARHDAILREAVETNRGQVVKTTGDGLHAVFTSTRTAVTAAITAQRALGAEEWGATGELRVRMGVHTGDAELRGGDYYGPATNRAARVMAAAHGGQVVVSHATEEILRDVLPDDVALVDLGEHRLPDLARPERIFQVTAAGLRREFPALRTLDALPGNLPTQLSSFIGRALEREAVADALLTSRLVTVTGVAGVGKSRLAVQVAYDVLRRFPDGAWLCELVTAQDVGDVARIVATTLGAVPQPGATLMDAIVDALRAKKLLIMFDNAEHVLDAVGTLVRILLRSCPDVRIVATSREALGIEGEQVWPLASLSVPSTLDLGEATQAEAVALFVERARAVQPGFMLDAANVAAVAEICRRLDGIPLAVELAAARVTIMSPADIASRLDQRFQLLTAGRRGASERHQTLRDAIEWSYELLDDKERLLFERLGLFPRSFDTDAVVAVAAGDGLEVWDVLDALAGLVAKSMLVADEATGTARYHMLETLQAFAREQLQLSGDRDRRFRLHAEHYARFAEEAEIGLSGPDEVRWRHRVHLEYANLRAAFIRSTMLGTDDDLLVAMRIVGALTFEAVHDHALGFGAWAEELAPKADLAPPPLRTSVLAAAAFSAQGRHDADAMREFAHAALRDGVPPNSSGVVWAYIALASSERLDGDLDAAGRIIKEAIAALEAAGEEPRVMSFMHSAAANFYNLSGDFAAARTAAERALEYARQTRSPTAVAGAQFAIGLALTHTDPERALAALDESLDLARQGASGGLSGFALGRRAVLRVGRGDAAGALDDIRDAVEHSMERADRPMLMTALECALIVLDQLGREEAAAVIAGALEAGSIGDRSRATAPGMAWDLGIVDAVTHTRDVLGEAAFADASRRGARMTSDDISEFVLEVVALTAPVG